MGLMSKPHLLLLPLRFLAGRKRIVLPQKENGNGSLNDCWRKVIKRIKKDTLLYLVINCSFKRY